MSYYPTLDEDVARAKEILAKGRADSTALQHMGLTPENLPALVGGAIYGADIFAAYKLLESFVEALDAVGPKVAELAIRHNRRRGD